LLQLLCTLLCRNLGLLLSPLLRCQGLNVLLWVQLEREGKKLMCKHVASIQTYSFRRNTQVSGHCTCWRATSAFKSTPVLLLVRVCPGFFAADAAGLLSS
jgi:hypothetical protein